MCEAAVSKHRAQLFVHGRILKVGYLEVHGTYEPSMTVLRTVLLTVLIVIFGHLRGL